MEWRREEWGKIGYNFLTVCKILLEYMVIKLEDDPNLHADSSYRDLYPQMDEQRKDAQNLLLAKMEELVLPMLDETSFSRVDFEKDEKYLIEKLNFSAQIKNAHITVVKGVLSTIDLTSPESDGVVFKNVAEVQDLFTEVLNLVHTIVKEKLSWRLGFKSKR